MNKFATCLWFDHQAEEAVRFYSTVFANVKVGTTARYGKAGAEVSGQKEGSVMTVDFVLENLFVQALNGGPLFKFTPALSFFVSCDSEAEITEKWKKLSEGGKVRMGLDKYPWAERYGWTADKYGVEWQLILSPRRQKIAPALLFVDDLFGRGEEAIGFYTSLFPSSKIETIARDESTKTVAHCAFTLNGEGFVLMEGPGKHGYTFNEATSLVVNCANQGEIDFYWEKLSEGGAKGPCGWLKDKYGVSWQIVPSIMYEVMKDPVKADKAMEAILKMQKLDLAAIQRAVQ